MKKTERHGMSREKELKERLHVTRPPRLAGKVKNAKMNPVRKRKTEDLVREFRDDVPDA